MKKTIAVLLIPVVVLTFVPFIICTLCIAFMCDYLDKRILDPIMYVFGSVGEYLSAKVK